MPESVNRPLDPVRANALSNAVALAIALANNNSPMTTEELVETATAFEDFLGRQ